MLSWTGAALTLFSVWLVGRKDWRGWIVGLIAQVVWTVFALHVGDGGLLFVELAIGGIALNNLYQWRKDKQRGKEQVAQEGLRPNAGAYTTEQSDS